MIRLKDIALHAGVSVMTVSKALRERPDVSAHTRDRIKQLARQMGYVPDNNAQSLRTRTTRLLGVVVPSVTDPAFSRVLVALEERAHELGFELILAQTMHQEEREAKCIERLFSRRVDGIFIAPVYRHKPEAPVYQALQALGTQVVILGHHAPFTRQFANVETDDLLASYAVTSHLLELGHRQIAFFAGPQVAPWCQERFEGYRRALRERGIEVEDRLVFQSGYTIEDGEKAALQFANESAPATAIQAVNDMVAIGSAKTLLGQGVRIPGDISIAGFGNTLTSEHFRVPLTTTRQPKHRLGMAAMDTMVKLLNRERAEIKRLRADLIPRQSTGPVKVV